MTEQTGNSRFLFAYIYIYLQFVSLKLFRFLGDSVFEFKSCFENPDPDLDPIYVMNVYLKIKDKKINFAKQYQIYIDKSRFTEACLWNKNLDPDPFFLPDPDPDLVDPRRPDQQLCYILWQYIFVRTF